MRPSVTAVGYIPIRPDWLAQHTEEIIEPDLPIIDTHHHLWERPGWRYLFHEFMEDINSGHNIAATVFVQARAMYRADGPDELKPLGETEYVNGVAAMSASGLFGTPRVAAGIVGYVDLMQGGAVEELLHEHRRVAGPRLRGIRNHSTWDAEDEVIPSFQIRPKGMLAMPKFREGFARLAPLKLTFDAWLFYTQMNELIDLARAFPQTTIVMDHVGGPIGVGSYASRRDEMYAGWLKGLREVATCPNIYVKLGGLGMRVGGLGLGDGPEPPSSQRVADTLRPFIEPAIEAFGTRRAMFESNFPVDLGSSSYQVLWNAFKRLARGASAAEKTDLFSGSAERAYGKLI